MGTGWQKKYQDKTKIVSVRILSSELNLRPRDYSDDNLLT